MDDDVRRTSLEYKIALSINSPQSDNLDATFGYDPLDKVASDILFTCTIEDISKKVTKSKN